MQGDASDPTVSQNISVGNVCIFKLSMNEWKIGRVLNFTYYLEKYKSSQYTPIPHFTLLINQKRQ